MWNIDKYDKRIAKVPLYLFIFFIVFTFGCFSDMNIPLLLRLGKHYPKSTRELYHSWASLHGCISWFHWKHVNRGVAQLARVPTGNFKFYKQVFCWFLVEKLRKVLNIELSSHRPWNCCKVNSNGITSVIPELHQWNKTCPCHFFPCFGPH